MLRFDIAAADNHMTDPAVIDARATAYRLALETLGSHATLSAAAGDGTEPRRILALAKEIETWFWGGFAPIEKPPTPLSTIEEAAAATKARVLELALNSADAALARDLEGSLAYYERFIAEVHGAIQRGQERAGRPVASTNGDAIAVEWSHG